MKINDSEVKSYVDDISITPLAIPMICGPGAITNAIVLMEGAGTVEKKVVLVVTIFIVMSLTYLILYSSSRIIKVLGTTGNNVLMRLIVKIFKTLINHFPKKNVHATKPL